MKHPLRDPTSSEQAFVADVLRRLREHFHEWSGLEGHEHDLVGFAIYEGCGGTEHCGEIIARAAPLALGKELVSKHGFHWVMIGKGDGWRYGVGHPGLNEPIDLLALEHGAWNNVEYDQPPPPGRTTHDSLETIVAQVQQVPQVAE